MGKHHSAARRSPTTPKPARKLSTPRWCASNGVDQRTRPCPTSPLTSASHVEPSTATSPPPKNCSPRSPRSRWTAGSADRSHHLGRARRHGPAGRIGGPHHRRAAQRTTADAATGQRPHDTVQPQMLQPPDRARPKDPAPHAHRLGRLGYDDAAIDELVEFLLRNIQSMIIAPPRTAPHRHPTARLPAPLDRAGAQTKHLTRTTPSHALNAQVDSFASSRSVVYTAKAALAQRMHASGESASTIATTLGVSRATVYRVLEPLT